MQRSRQGKAKPVPVKKGKQKFFTSSSGGGATVNNGSDPLLGPPYLPVDYELLANVTAPRLTWNVPVVGGAGALRFYNTTNASVYVRFNTSGVIVGVNNPVVRLVLANTHIDLSVPANVLYIWVTHSSAVPDSVNFPSEVRMTVPQSPPPQYILWLGAGLGSGNTGFPAASGYEGYLSYVPLNSITGFSLYRRTDASFTGSMPGGINYGTYNPGSDAVLASPLATDTFYSDTAVPSSRFYYRLVGHTSSFDFIYNDVYIVAAPVLNVSPSGNSFQLSWTGDASAASFKVNRSVDGGATWTTLTTISGTGLTNYSYLDSTPPTTNFEYQVIEVLPDTTQVPSNVVTVSTSVPSGIMDWVRELVAAQSLFILPVITTDFLGNVVVGGSTGGPVNFGNGDVGVSANSAAFIAKYSTSNALLWSLSIGNTVSLCSIQGVVTDSLGNIFVAGTFAAANATPMDFGGITKSTGSSSTSNIFVAKYGPGAPNSPPTALWVKQYGVGGSIKSQGIAIDNSDNPTIVAYYQSPVDFGGGPIGGAFFNLIILRVSSLDGSTLLAKPFGGGAGVWQNLSISTNPQGTSIGISGLISSGSNDFGAGTTTGQFFAKYSGTTGNLIWSKQPTNLGLCVTAIDPITDNFYVSGGFTTGIDFGGGPSHIDNPDHGGVFIAAFDLNGNWKWNKFAGEEGNIAYAIATDGNNVYICGQGASMDWDRSGIVAGGNGYFLAYFKVNGAFNLLKFSTGSYPSTGHSVAVDKTLNKVFGCGYFSTSPITLDSIVLPANGSDGFIAKYEP